MTRRSADDEYERLRAAGWLAGAYHAGLDGASRQRVQASFSERRLEVVVATNAFGMGIDRADVRAVIHLGPPGSIEAYYQEVGRAGRDGADAWGLLLVSPADMPLRRRLLERGGDGGPTPSSVVEHKWGMFLELLRWAEGGSCRTIRSCATSTTRRRRCRAAGAATCAARCSRTLAPIHRRRPSSCARP
jgi:ATP-dependent DNA helicase RecQ